MINDTSREHLAQKGAWVSIFAYLFMAALKLTIGYTGHSSGLWADGLNNTTDIMASVAVLIGLKISAKPPDDDHLYGHTRAETVASLITAFIMVTIGVQVISQAIDKMLQGHTESPSMLSALAAVFSAVFMLFIYRYNRRLSRKLNNASLHAVAKDNLSDALVSIGAFIGIIGTHAGLLWLDTAAALVVGLIICKTAWDIFREATHSLTDGFDQSLLNDIKETISTTDGVLQVSDIKGRMHGNDVLLEATIKVESTLTVIESHDISEQVESTLNTQHGIHHAIIHVEPYTEKEPLYSS